MNEVAAGAVVNPFVGLRPYEEREAYLFFGRDGQSDELTARLARKRFVAVVGVSGSGKSSLVRAGLFASLQGGFMAGAGSSWRIALLRPGNAPLASLAAALHDALSDNVHAEPDVLPSALIEATLRRSSLGLIEAVRQARIAPDDNVLVVVDQFEELFRFKRAKGDAQAEADAAAFVKLLIEVLQQDAVPIYVMLTMRSDFLGDCAQFRGLPEAMNDSQYLIPRMNRDERRQAIVGPIGVGGAHISPRLVQRLLNDVGEDPDQLPVLQHALMRTWQRWEQHRQDGSPLDLDDYEAIGTMEHALSRHADEAFGELGETQNKIAARVFKRLTERGPDNREIRRPTRFGELCAVAAAPAREVAAVIDRFRSPACSFLMPPAESPLQEDTFVDISHESLIRKWGRLRSWVDEETNSRAMYARVADAAHRHQAGEAGLWRNPDLKLARDWFKRERPNGAWAERYGGGFDLAYTFLRRSTRRSFIVRGTLAAVLIVSYGATLISMQETARQKKMTGDALSTLSVFTYQLPKFVEKIPRAKDAVMDFYDANIGVFEALGALAGETQASPREQASNYMLLGDIWSRRGDLTRARESYEKALAEYQLLVKSDPTNPNWQRNLSIYYERMGNVLLAEGDRLGALEQYRTGLGIVQGLATVDPANPQWQLALSISHEKLGDVLLAQGDAAGALREYETDLSIAERLAAADPANGDRQEDVAISHEKMAMALTAADRAAEAAAHGRSARRIRELLQQK